MTESEQRVKELSGQLEMAHAANAALTSRTQLLEKFMGLQESGQGAELTGELHGRLAADPYTWSLHPGLPKTCVIPLNTLLHGQQSVLSVLSQVPDLHGSWQAMKRPDAWHSVLDRYGWVLDCILAEFWFAADAWWLDAVTRQMVEQRLNLGRALTFTLRAGHPISLTREQARRRCDLAQMLMGCPQNLRRNPPIPVHS